MLALVVADCTRPESDDGELDEPLENYEPSVKRRRHAYTR